MLNVSHINVVSGNLKIISSFWCMASVQNRWTNERSCTDNTTSYNAICEFTDKGLSPFGIYFLAYLNSGYRYSSDGLNIYGLGLP